MRAHLLLSSETGDGERVIDHVKKAAEAGNKAAQAQLDAATVPAAAEHVWLWYWELRASTPDGFSRSPISFQEIDAWIRCTNLEPRAWEVRALRAMDVELHNFHAEKRDKDKKREKSKGRGGK